MSEVPLYSPSPQHSTGRENGGGTYKERKINRDREWERESVCACVSERQSEREREREKERERERERQRERARERTRARERGRERERGCEGEVVSV